MSEPLGWHEGHQLVAEIGSERNLVDRIRYERQQRGWTQAELANRAHMHQSAISKLEARQRERGISVAEALVFAKVFDVPLGELLLPADALGVAAAWREFIEAAELRNTIRNTQGQYDHEIAKLRSRVAANAELADRFRTHRAEVMEQYESHAQTLVDRENQLRRLRGEPDQVIDDEWRHLSRPPVVLAIDDVLDGLDES